VLLSLQTGLFCRLAVYTGNETIQDLVVLRPLASTPPAARQRATSAARRPPPPGPRLKRMRSPLPTTSASSSTFGPSSAGRRLSAAGPPPRLPRTAQASPAIGAKQVLPQGQLGTHV
jgi:hypothetical protein